MENISPEVKELLNLLKPARVGSKETKLVAMLAPSFPVDFAYPEIVGMLKRLGFKYVVGVARGAEETNKQLLALLKLHPNNRYITSPCPTIVRLIRNKYPELIPYLAKIDSPMSAIAKIVAKKYPNCKKVFIGPCFSKKSEAKEDRKELDILVLSYKELKKVFETKKISLQKKDKNFSFDIEAKKTRLYPISGGLAQSSGLTKKLTDLEYDVISGPKLSEKILAKFSTDVNLKILDILYCDGGCINGPGIITKDSLAQRRKKVISQWKV